MNSNRASQASPLVHFIRRHPRAAGFIFLGFLFGLFLGGVETLFYFLPKGTRSRVERINEETRGIYRSIHRVNGKTIFDVVRHFDKKGNRIVPGMEDGKGNPVLIVEGCSFTLGWGVEDGQTLPAAAGRHLPGWLVINEGFGGWGPSNILHKVRAQDYAGELGGRQVYMVYVFIPAHVQRAVGTFRYVTAPWTEEFPYFCLDSEGNFVEYPTYEAAHPWRSRVYGALSHETVLKYFNVDFPPAFSASHYDYTARMIGAIRDEFGKSFDPGDFSVILYPDLNPAKEARRIVDGLTKRGIRVLDYTDVLPKKDAEYFFVEDFHPTPKTHEIVGERLAGDLLAIESARH